MSVIKNIDHGVGKFVFSAFWWFVDPLEPERLYRELTDVMDRNLDANYSDRLFAPDNFDIAVNNKVFIKHAHSIKKLESSLEDRLRKYAAEKDYELQQPAVKLRIFSSATLAKHKTEIRCWYTSADDQAQPNESADRTYRLEVIDGQGKGLEWPLQPGNVYSIGRTSASDICLPFDNISKKQATLYFLSNDRITLVDEGSANGTFFAEEPEPISGSRELKLGDQIRFAKLNPTVLILSAK